MAKDGVCLLLMDAARWIRLLLLLSIIIIMCFISNGSTSPSDRCREPSLAGPCGDPEGSLEWCKESLQKLTRGSELEGRVWAFCDYNVEPEAKEEEGYYCYYCFNPETEPEENHYSTDGGEDDLDP